MRTRVRYMSVASAFAAASLSLSPELQSQDLEVDVPAAILKEIPFTLKVASEGNLDTVGVVVRFADGTILADTTIAPLGSLSLRDVTVSSKNQLPIGIETADGLQEFTRPLIPGWFSILPPLIAILLALTLHEVVTSLFVGVWLGCFFVAGYNPLAATLLTIERYAMPALADPDHASIVIFSLLLGGMVGVIGKMGGTQAIVEAVKPLATSARRAQFAAWIAGLAIFFDDYANTLIVGNTMRPLTDRLKVSREKLAYIVDSTAAPVAAIVFVSTWVGYQISLIGDGLTLAAEQNGHDPVVAAQLMAASPFEIFVRTIPYLFYPILAIFAVGLFILSRRDFGPMLSAERRASSGGGLHRAGAQPAADMDGELGSLPEGVPLRWWNGVLPVLTVVVTVLAGLIYTGTRALGEGEVANLPNILGNADPFATLLWGSLAGCIVGILLAVGQRILPLADAIGALVSGMKAMTLAIVILVLAWSLGAVTGSLSTASFLAGVLSDRLPLELLPVTVFIVAALISFATGTSWGTMAILIPLVVPLSVAMGANLGGGIASGELLGGIASVLAGSIFGDHCSPISDTTVMSSMASGCDHVDHVRTQLPYALLVAAVAAIALTVVSVVFRSSPWAAVGLTVVGCGVLYLFVRIFGEVSAVSEVPIPVRNVAPVQPLD